MENIAIQTAAVTQDTLTIQLDDQPARKRPTWLGKLNRTAAKAMVSIVANGHSDTRFKRDYINGVSTYVCRHCNAGAIAIAVDGRGKSKMEGDALTSPCPGPQSEK